MSRITLRDIAKRTGFVHSTISLALRGSPKVHAETKAQIVAVARELGYTPHPLIAALMQSRRLGVTSGVRAVIGFLRFHAERQDAMSVTTRKVLEGATARANQFGYHVEALWADNPKIPNERLAGILEARGVTGVLVGPAPKETNTAGFPWERWACVSLNLGLLPGVDYVGHGYYDGMRLALAHCRQQGFRRVGVALPAWKNSQMLDQYLLPFHADGALAPRRKIPPLLYPMIPDAALAAWLKRHQPEVVISSIDSEQGAEFVSRIFPRAIAYVSLNATEGSTAGVDQNRPLIGAVAIDQLIAKINRNERGLSVHAHTTYVTGRWLPGPGFDEAPREKTGRRAAASVASHE